MTTYRIIYLIVMKRGALSFMGVFFFIELYEYIMRHVL